jgi:hypothetical protein
LKVFVQRTRSPGCLDDAHDGADIQQTGEKKRADPDAKLLEHREVTAFELATELNGGRGRAGQGVYNYKSKHFSMADSAKPGGGS